MYLTFFTFRRNLYLVGGNVTVERHFYGKTYRITNFGAMKFFKGNAQDVKRKKLTQIFRPTSQAEKHGNSSDAKVRLQRLLA